MINSDGVTKKNIKEQNPNWRFTIWKNKFII